MHHIWACPVEAVERFRHTASSSPELPSVTQLHREIRGAQLAIDPSTQASIRPRCCPGARQLITIKQGPEWAPSALRHAVGKCTASAGQQRDSGTFFRTPTNTNTISQLRIIATLNASADQQSTVESVAAACSTLPNVVSANLWSGVEKPAEPWKGRIPVISDPSITSTAFRAPLLHTPNVLAPSSQTSS